jgi:hypothetical protein
LTNLGIIFSLLVVAGVISYLIFSASLRFLGGLSAVNKLAGFGTTLSAFLRNRLDKEEESIVMILIIFYLPAEIFFTIPLLVSGFYSGHITSGILSAIFINSLLALSLYYATRSGVLNFSSPVWLDNIIDNFSNRLSGGKK